MPSTKRLYLPCGDCREFPEWYTWKDQRGLKYQTLRCPRCTKKAGYNNCPGSPSIGWCIEEVISKWNDSQRKLLNARRDIRHQVEKEVLASLLGLLTDSGAYECGHCGAHHKPEKLTAHIQDILKKL